MKRYEYEWVQPRMSITASEFQTELNEMGKLGWELVQIVDHGGCLTAWLKRELEVPSDTPPKIGS